MIEPKNSHPIVQWSGIEKLANNEISRLIGIVPIVGYLILFNDKVAEVLSFGTIAGNTDASDSRFFLSGLTKLRLAFFGSIFVFLANLLFKIYSPKVLVFAKDEFAFSGRLLENYSAHEIKEIEREIFSENWAPRALWRAARDIGKEYRISTKPKLQGFAKRSYMKQEDDEYIGLLAREWWSGEMHSAPIVRLMCFGLCVGGFLMLAIPTVDIAQAVIVDLWTNLTRR